MAEITMPSTPAPRSMDWRYVKPAQTNVSEWTGARQVLDSGRGWWECTISLPPLFGDDIFAWRGFISACRGPVNTFKVYPIVSGNQISATVGTLLSNGASQTGTSIAVDGGTASQTPLIPAGAFITIDDQLVRLAGDLDSDGTGAGTMSIEPAVRAAVADNTAIEYDNPYMMAYLVDQPVEGNTLADMLTLSFTVREAF